MRVFTQLLALLVAGVATAQPPAPPKAADKPKASAIKLPDGTVVFVVKGADDPNPIVDGVVLSPAEFQSLVEQAEAAKRAKEAARPVPPSGVAVVGAIEARGERTVAALTLTFSFRTTVPRTAVTLGCQRAAVVAARSADGKLPVLTADADGLTVLAESAGEHVVTIQAEVPVSGRAAKGEVGFDLGLPRAAISTFRLTKPPADGVGRVNIGARGDIPATVKRTAFAADQLTAKPIALGATDLLEVTWEAPGTTPGDPGLSADADVQVRVEESQVETVARLRLKGAAREWQLTLPPVAEVTVAPAAGPLPMPTPTVVKPAEPGKPWVVRTPLEGGEWLVAVSVRVLRPKASDPKHRGPYTIGPFAVNGVRPTGKVSVYAPAGIRLGLKPSADLRRQDLPTTADDDLVAVFTTPAGPKAGGWVEVDARPAVGQLRVRPQHRLRLVPGGWKLETTVRVVPPQRTELDTLALEVPAEWTSVEVGPAEFAEVAPDGGDGRTYSVRFATPQRTAFEFTLSAIFPIRVPTAAATIPLPRFPQAEERDTKLTASVGDGYEVSGTGFGWENGLPAAAGESLKGSGRGAATTTTSGDFDRGASRVELRWQAYRPELACESRAEVTVHPRQLAVSQTLKFTAPDGDVKTVRLRGPEEVVGVRAKPLLEPVGRGEWEFRPAADAAREFTLTVQFAVPLPPGATTTAIPLLWCEPATRTEAVVRVWGGGGPRAEGFTGRWRETHPEPATDRDSLPWFTLTAGGPEPLTLTLADGPDTGGTVVDRGLIQAAIGADGSAFVRGLFALRRWPGGGVEIDLPAGSVPDVLVDGKRAEPVRVGERLIVPIPDARPGGTVMLEVRTQGVTAPDGRGGRVITPPTVKGASYRGPVRWYVACPGERVPIVFDAGWDAEHRWSWRGYGVGPGPADSATEMEGWLRGGGEGDNSGEGNATIIGDAVAVRRATADPLRISLAPRWVWVLLASGAGLAAVAGLGQLRAGAVAAAVAVAAVGLGAGAIFLPQPTAQAVAAMQPGLALGAMALAGRYGWQWYRRWKVERRSTFSRTLPPSDPATPTAPRSSRPGGSVVPFEARPT